LGAACVVTRPLSSAPLNAAPRGNWFQWSAWYFWVADFMRAPVSETREPPGSVRARLTRAGTGAGYGRRVSGRWARRHDRRVRASGRGGVAWAPSPGHLCLTAVQAHGGLAALSAHRQLRAGAFSPDGSGRPAIPTSSLLAIAAMQTLACGLAKLAYAGGRGFWCCRRLVVPARS
jgi:hypothetical protein